MTRSSKSNGLKPVTRGLLVAVGLVAVLGSAGCDELGNLASWGGLASPWSTSSMGLPVSPPSYWQSLGYGTENVDSWGGLANSWYTSSIGLPVAPW